MIAVQIRSFGLAFRWSPRRLTRAQWCIFVVLLATTGDCVWLASSNDIRAQSCRMHGDLRQGCSPPKPTCLLWHRLPIYFVLIGQCVGYIVCPWFRFLMLV